MIIKRFSLQFKFFSLIVLILIVVSFLTFKFIGDYITRELKREISLRAEILAKNIAENSEDALIERDDLSLFKFVKDAVRNEGIVYAFIVDDRGIIRAHSDIEKFGEKYEGKGKENSGDIIEIYYPIKIAGKKEIGRVFLGVSLKSIYEKIKNLRNSIMFITTIILIGGFILTLLMTKFMTDPIRILLKGTEEIAKGNFDFRIEKIPRDEIGELASAFNKMARSLKEKELIKDAFKRYVSKQVAEEIFKNPAQYVRSLKGERRKVAVLFADIRGFTPLAERLPPEEVVGILNQYLSIMTDIVFKYEGTLDKFIGDCIMSVFGAPVYYPDAALRAVRAAYEIQNYLRSLNIKRKKENKIPVYVGIGINYGEVVVGNIGSKERLEYTVIGDTVNVASRLENIAREEEIIISESVYSEIKNFVKVKKLRPVILKGKKEPLNIYLVEKVL